jgi:predicted DCC family thiol-disulfide oxidoreductase YuxK
VSAEPTEPETKSVVLFDGVCNVCNSTVNFIIDRDPKGHFRFASLQSPEGRALAEPHGIASGPETPVTMALIEGSKAYTESAALFRITRRLRAPWPLLTAAMIVPRGLRDVLYRFFAARRYKWFGRSESCRVPTPEIRGRFLSA